MENKNSYLAVGVELGDKLDDGRRRYRIVRYIKSGGFGNTYEAEDRKFLGRRVAIKELFVSEWCSRSKDSLNVSVSVESNRISFTKQKEKFIKEAVKLNGFVKDGIVRVIDVFEANGTAYYAMDYIDGGSLAMRLKSKGGKPMTESEVRGYLDQILDALEYVHREGLLHLDLKPGNIMVDSKGKVTLIDFGASKQVEAVDGKSLSSSSGISYTRGFAPTEQIDGSLDKMGTHTDMYSLGATLYNLLTGKIPPSPSDIDAEGLPEIIGISQQMSDVIKKCLIPNRNKRLKTVCELRELLACSKKEPEKPSGLNDDSDAGDGETERRKKRRSRFSINKSEAKIIGIIILAIIIIVGIERCDGFGGDPSLGGGDTVVVTEDFYEVSDSIKYEEPEISATTQEEDLSQTEDQRKKEETTSKAPNGAISTSREVDLGLSVTWAGWNVGASSPEGYGDYFAWGETSPKNGEYVESTYRHHDGSSYVNIGSNISGTQYDAARANWGGTWRMPTKAECEELRDRCSWTWTTYRGVSGMKVTGPNGNSIFLPASGYRGSTLYDRGSNGYFWSGSLGESGTDYAWTLGFLSDGASVNYRCRESGHSVRPVKAR